TRDGIVTIEVNNAAGAVVVASHLPALAGTRNIVAIAMDMMFNGQYSIVGRVNTNPNQGFLLRYLPGLPPVASTIYPAPGGGNFYMTGVKPFAGPVGTMMTSFEWINGLGALVPGMIALNPV